MKAFVKREVEVTLVLNEQEAMYLKTLVQNYLGENPRDELVEQKKIRTDIWEALHSQGIKL